MIKVGITGGIGAGKSLICRVFNMLGIPLYNADYYAKFLMQSDEKLIQSIKKAFGDRVYKNNRLDRKALAEIVFNHQEKLNQLNQLVHPVVFAHTEAWFKKLQHQTASSPNPLPYAIKEAALLFETGAYQNLDVTILVVAPEDIRINRVMQRDKTDAESIKSRMNKQWSDEQKTELAQYCIYNDDMQAVIPQVNEIHRQLMANL